MMGFKFLLTVLFICLAFLGDCIAAAGAPGEVPNLLSTSRKFLGSKANMHQKEHSKNHSSVFKSIPAKRRKPRKAAAAVAAAFFNGVAAAAYKNGGGRRRGSADGEEEVFFNMLHKDYQMRARRRPPIHN